MRGQEIFLGRSWRGLVSKLGGVAQHGRSGAKPYLVALLYLGIGLGAVAWALVQAVLPAHGEIKALLQEQGQGEENLRRVRQFALSHADYENYAIHKEQQLQQMRSKLVLFRDMNQAQSRLQQLAVREGLLIRQLQLVEQDLATQKPSPKPPLGKQAELAAAPRLTSRQLHMELMGDYFALVRWLKQVEKQQLQVQRMEIRGNQGGMVQAELTLRCWLQAS